MTAQRMIDSAPRFWPALAFWWGLVGASGCGQEPSRALPPKPGPSLLAESDPVVLVGEQAIGRALFRRGLSSAGFRERSFSTLLSDVRVVEAANRLGPLAQAHLRAVRDEALALALRARLRADVGQGPDPGPGAPAILELELRRILVPDPLLAHELLSQLQPLDPKRWQALARQHSVDRATYLRAGDLGFVDPSGQTHRPQVRVASALYHAAMAVADGELVPAPVPEGRAWAVVWRRGSRPRRSESQLSSRLARFERSLTSLLGALRQRHLHDQWAERIGGWKPAVPALQPAPPPGTPRELWPPKPSDRGWR